MIAAEAANAFLFSDLISVRSNTRTRRKREREEEGEEGKEKKRKGGVRPSSSVQKASSMREKVEVVWMWGMG